MRAVMRRVPVGRVKSTKNAAASSTASPAVHLRRCIRRPALDVLSLYTVAPDSSCALHLKPLTVPLVR